MLLIYYYFSYYEPSTRSLNKSTYKTYLSQNKGRRVFKSRSNQPTDENPVTTNLTKHIIKPPVSGSAYCKSPFHFILNSFALLITTPSISLKRAEQRISVVGYDKQGKKICWLTLFRIISHCCSYIIIGFLISLLLINAKSLSTFRRLYGFCS